MMALTPYSGSLLRLALTTVAIMSVVALAVALWQENADVVHSAKGPRDSSVSAAVVSPGLRR